jgi:hypothetical protein
MMARIRRFIDKVDWPSTFSIVALFAFFTTTYAIYIDFRFSVGSIVGVALFWALFIGWPLMDIWNDTKNP